MCFLHVLTDLILRTTLGGGFYDYALWTDNETEAESYTVSDFPGSEIN